MMHTRSQETAYDMEGCEAFSFKFSQRCINRGQSLTVDPSGYVNIQNSKDDVGAEDQVFGILEGREPVGCCQSRLLDGKGRVGLRAVVGPDVGRC